MALHKLPKVVTLSIKTYRLMLPAYPHSFREEYGPHMLQVFGDTCLRRYSQKGLFGLFPLWIDTLLDFVQTVIEEHLQKEAVMSKDTLTRLTGGLLVLAGFSSLIWFFYNNHRISNLTEDQLPILFTGSIPYVTVNIVVNWLAFFGLYGVFILYKNILGKLAPVSIGFIFLTFLWNTLFLITINLDLPLLPIALQENTIRGILGFLGMIGFGAVLAKYKPLPKLNHIILITSLVVYLFLYILESPPATDMMRSLDRVSMNARLWIYTPAIVISPIVNILLGAVLLSNLKPDTHSGQNTPLATIS